MSLFLGGTRMGELTRPQASIRRAWRGCPSSGGYGAASCPVDFLGVLLGAQVNRMPLDYRPTAPRALWLTGGDNSAPGTAVSGFEVFFITPVRRVATLAFDFRYEVYVDEAGAIRAVNLLLSEP